MECFNFNFRVIHLDIDLYHDNFVNREFHRQLLSIELIMIVLFKTKFAIELLISNYIVGMNGGYIFSNKMKWVLCVTLTN